METVQTGLDLSAFNIEEGAEKGFKLELVDKTGRKTGEWIQIIGKDSKKVQAMLTAQNRRRWTRMQKQGAHKLTMDEVEDDALDLLAAATTGWSFKDRAGTAYPCNESNAINIYKQSTLIREQVEYAMTDRSNFTQS